MIIISDKNGCTDSVYHTLIKHINTNINIVLVSWVEEFIFNDDLFNIKDYILICYCEEGWDVPITESHIWGVNSDKFKRYNTNEWIKFDEWVRNNPPKLLFKRELLKKDVTDKIKPIDYPCILSDWPEQSEEEFNSRPINVFQYWGRSNECRIRIHGEIWIHAFKKGFQPCDNIYYINEYLKQESGEKWITLWIPHYHRLSIYDLMAINGMSKLSLSWPGAGFKCFRTHESPINSILVQHKNNFAFAYDWNETNCILVEPEKEIEAIEAALNNPNLYEIYKNSVETCRKYQIDNYVNNYILPIINNL